MERHPCQRGARIRARRSAFDGAWRAPSSARFDMAFKYDAVIIGGGHNGLVNAAYLARNGKKVGTELLLQGGNVQYRIYLVPLPTRLGVVTCHTVNTHMAALARGVYLCADNLTNDKGR